MKLNLRSFMAGALAATVLSCGMAYAKSRVETINATYDNIKVYVDNVLTELKDANGAVIEPFIYNGTTYLPVRGTAQAAGMQVTWDGASKSVYLWKNLMPDSAKFLDYCPPYQTSNYKEFRSTKGESFNMSGKKYSDGFTLTYGGSYALFNLDGKYSSINFTVGHVDGSRALDRTVSFIVDGDVVRELEINSDDLAKTMSIPVEYGLQLKILANGGSTANTGFADITVE